MINNIMKPIRYILGDITRPDKLYWGSATRLRVYVEIPLPYQGWPMYKYQEINQNFWGVWIKTDRFRTRYEPLEEVQL